MLRIAQGDARAFRQVTDLYLNEVLGFVFRLIGHRAEAEDVAQETFLRLWQNADRYEPQAKVSTWIYVIAHNAAVDRLRRRRPTSSVGLDELPASGRPSTLLTAKETALAVRSALDSLPPRQRAAISLVHYQGMSGSEAAEVLGVRLDAVESLLSRARRKLRQMLSSLGAASRDGQDHQEEIR